MHFAIFKTNDGKYYFRILSNAFNILSASDPVPDKESVYHAIEIIRLESSDASMLDFS